MSGVKETQKMKAVQLYEQTPKQFSNQTPTPKIAHQGPKKSKMTPKLSQNQMSEMEETKKMKVVQLHNETSKQFLIPTPTPKIVRQGPKKSKMTPKLSQNLMSQLKETKKMKVVHKQNPEKLVNHTTTSKKPVRAPKSQK